MPTIPTIAVRTDGQTEEFVPEAAAYFYTNDRAEINEDGTRITVVGTDANGKTVTLTYGLSQVIVETAEYDIPDEEVEFTTAPASTSRETVYGAEDSRPDLLILDGEPMEIPDDFRELWDRADNLDVSEDFICATGLDDGEDPIPNQYDAYWVLIKGELEGDDEPFFTHERLDE